MDTAEPVPLVLPVDLAGELLGLARGAAYRYVEGAGLALPGPGRKRVPTARLELLLGRKLTSEDVQAARARLQPKRDALQRYSADYHAARRANRSNQSASRGRRPTQGIASDDNHHPANHP